MLPRDAAPGAHSGAIVRRLRDAVVLLVLAAAAGTAGYHWIEGWPLLDSLYMTVITMATIGYGETHPLTPEGKAFTIAFIVTSIGVIGYGLSTLTSFIVEGEFNRMLRGIRMDKRITSLHRHVIVCGAGHTGRAVIEELHAIGTPLCVIERDAHHLEQLAAHHDVPHLRGDAMTDETLLAAGIGRAAGLVAALDDDKGNVFVVLTARSLNPSLRIVARVVEQENTPKLRKAGADEVVSPNVIGGLRMASLMARPSVVTFLDTMLRATDATVRFEEIAVDAGSPQAGRTVADVDPARSSGVLIVAVRKAGADFTFNPPPGTAIAPGDTIVVMGTRSQVEALRALR